MAKGVCESYEAFKARRQREFDTQYAGQTEATRQKLLRVHLRHFMLTVGAEVEQKERRRTGAWSEIEKPDDVVSKTAGSRSFAREQKRLAVAREAAKAQRQMSAATIQKFVRRRRRSTQREHVNEEELPSTSIMIDLEVEIPTECLAKESVIAPMDVRNSPTNSPPKAVLPPYEVVIELLAARDLALASSSAFYIEAEMLIRRQSGVIARVVSPRQFVSSFQDISTEFLLQNCSLRFAIDLNSGIKHGIASPHSVIEECSASMIVKAAGSSGANANILGVVEIPLYLLETPLAIEYSLCRWFPLEKAQPGHTVRGDLRVSVCYLMRETSSDTMAAYVNTLIATTTSEEIQEQDRKKPIRRMKTTSTRMAQRKSTLPRKKVLQPADQTTMKAEKLKPRTISLKDSLSSPIGRISRAEALSPPPSPSSMTSSETDESVPAPDLPKVRHQVKASGRFFPPKKSQKHSKPIENSPPKEEEEVQQTKASSPRSSAKTFLKRKPYKVVFQKLDWSSVSSKTNSNLVTGVNKNSGVASRSSKTSRSDSRASSTPQLSSSNGDTGMDCGYTSNSVLVPSNFVDSGTSQRFAALESAMYERCGVTRDSASLARFKYQTERKKFLANLQNQAPSQDRSEQLGGAITTDDAVTELWKKLTADSSGQIYAAMLRSLTERQPTPTDPVASTS